MSGPRQVPRTDVLLADARLVDARQRLGENLVRKAVHAAQDMVREGSLQSDDVLASVIELLPAHCSSLRTVLNATGVVLHTNLGRAVLSAAAVDAMVAASGYVDLEFDLVTGARAERGSGVMAALRSAVPEGYDVLVVNNGAAGLVLIATVLALGREIVVSRGEMVEIGDGFRIPELIEATGARIREVGATNRTYLSDYRSALGPDTALVLKVHPSNFAISGFAASTSVAELASLGVPVVGDVGSGLLTRSSRFPQEPDATSWLRDGADLVSFSGDKLLGGPQAGLVVGRPDLIMSLRRHPLFRALRIDKLRLAALEASVAGPVPPTVMALTVEDHELQSRVAQLADDLGAQGVKAAVVRSSGLVGGGGVPGMEMSGWAAELPEPFAPVLRAGDPPVVGRVARGRCLLDLRCIPASDDGVLRDAVLRAATVLGLLATT